MRLRSSSKKIRGKGGNKMGLFDDIKTGLGQAIEYEKGHRQIEASIGSIHIMTTLPRKSTPRFV